LPTSLLWYVHPALRAPPRIVWRVLGGLTSVVLALAALVFPAAGGADRTRQLRAQGTTLAASQRTALLQLYAVGSRLDRARANLAEIDGRLSALRRELATETRELLVARRTFAIAQRRLGIELRALYAQGEVDPLAIILGSTSLDEMITRLDDLNRAARSTDAVVEQAKEARRTTVRLLASLERRSRELGRLRAATAAGAAELEAARAERIASIGRLRAERRLNARQIASLESRARAADAAATVAAVNAQTVSSASVAGAVLPIQRAARSGARLTVLATAYSLPGSTASGLPVGPGVVAVDPAVIPLGTRMSIPGYGEGIAADTGTAIKGQRIDLWFPTLRQAQSWGARTVTITLH
jgi:peptidoglycan DL-endopeptidase CwlO